MSLLYLAAPYSHIDPVIRQHRFRTACRAAAILMKAGVVVFNPLSHSIPIAGYIGEVESDHDFWMSIDIPILQRCDELLIIGLDGWSDSKGVRREMFEALALQKPVVQIEEADIDHLPAIPKTARTYLKSNIFKEVYDADRKT